MTSIEIPLQTGRGLNGREHHMARHRRVKREREAVSWMLRGKPPAAPLVVTLTRVSPSSGLDDDNLVGAMKACRDQIAQWLGIDDGDPSVQYRYAQQRADKWAVILDFAAA